MKAVRINRDLLRQIRGMPATDRRKIGGRIADAQRTIGQPHLHKGLGLRKLQDTFYEIRVGLKDRLVFENLADELVFEFLGDHDRVKRFLKSR